MKAICAAAGLALTVATIAGRDHEGPTPAAVASQQFLAAHFQLGTRDFKDLERRRPVTRTLSTSDGREVATLGVVRIGTPATFYLDQLRDIAAFKRAGSAVQQIGVFSTPARVDDLAGLSLDEQDVESLRRCRARDCKLQLSAEALARFQRDVRWDRPGAKGDAERTMREILVELVDRYRRDGDAALMTYIDSDRPLSLANEFRSMVGSRPAILERFPSLHRHLLEFPRRPADGIEDIVYWSKEKMGPAVIIGVTHLAISRIASSPEDAYVAASRQLYGSHYFDSSLGITVLLDAPDTGGPGMIMAYVNRSRLDALGGFFGGLKRAIVRSRTRSAMDSSLVEARDLVERRYRSPAASLR